MKQKNTLLIVFFLTLFVFQQVQAGATIPSVERPSQVNPAPANVGILYDTFYVYVYHLVPADQPFAGSILNPGSPIQCEWPTSAYGCGSEPPGSLREPEGFFHVASDYYLRNVLPSEMNFAEIAPDPNAEALKAQAVAARTFASYKSAFFPQEVVGTFNVINNSTEFQVFILGSYNDYPNYQDEVETALNATQGQFLSAGDGHTIDAQFSSDIIGQSLYGNQPYLIPIQEPISSSTCNLPGATGNGWGMSQRGAIRWAKGNTCPDGTGTAWPVKWDYKQILVHYYTGIDIVVDGSGNKVAPDDRWNLLKHGVPSQMTSGITQSVEIWLQNTSTTEWTDAVLGYQWVGTNIPWTEINLPVMPAGKDEKIQVDIIPPSANGTYTLRLDVKHANGVWFSEQTPLTWPDVEIPVTVTGSIATPTPPPPPGQTISIPISLGSDDGGTNPGDCAFSNTDNEVYLGTCFNGGDITSGFRFQNVPIPRDANIESAYIRFTVDGQYTAPISVTIDVENSVNPLTYSASSPPSNRLTTGSPVAWNITDTWNLGETRDTPDLSGLIHSIVVLPDWNLGQPISIIVNNAGPDSSVRRVIGFERVSFDPGLSAARLVVTYNLNPTPTPTATPVNYTPQPTFPPTSIPPTFTHLPPPPTTNPPPPWCGICDWGCQPNPAQRFSSGPGFYGTPTPYAVTPAPSSLRIAEAVDLTTLLYRVRDEILSATPEGQRLTELYYSYIPNIVQVLMAHPELSDSSLETMDLFVPSLQALLDGNGDTVTITSEQVAGLQSFLDALVEFGDAELQGVIQSELERRPLESIIGMTMDDAWDYLNGYQLQWLQPVSNGSPYQSQIGRTIPIQFTLADMEGNFVADPSVTIELADADGNAVVGPIGLSNNPATGIVIQGGKYHYNLQTKGLSAGLYTLRVYYNSVNPGQPYTWTIDLAAGKK